MFFLSSSNTQQLCIGLVLLLLHIFLCMDGDDTFSRFPFYQMQGVQPFGIQQTSRMSNMGSSMNMQSTHNILGSDAMGSQYTIADPSAMPPPPPPHDENMNSGALSLMIASQMRRNSGDGPTNTSHIVEPVKRKRGRPRKYAPAPEGSKSTSMRSSTTSAMPEDSLSQKKRRGRPPGTGRQQQLAKVGNWFSSSAGMGFTPHTITVSPGQDIAARIAAFSNQCSRPVSVISATGFVSRADLRRLERDSTESSQSSSTSSVATFEDTYEILSLSGSFNPDEDSDSPNGGLTVVLSGPDGLVGGGLLGNLTAATNVQVTLGSFLFAGSKSKTTKTDKEPVTGFGPLTIEKNDAPSNSAANQNLAPSVNSGWQTSSATLVDPRNSSNDINYAPGLINS